MEAGGLLFTVLLSLSTVWRPGLVFLHRFCTTAPAWLSALRQTIKWSLRHHSPLPTFLTLSVRTFLCPRPLLFSCSNHMVCCFPVVTHLLWQAHAEYSLTEEAQTPSVCKVCSDPRLFFGNPKTLLHSSRPGMKSKKERDGLYCIDVILGGPQHNTVLRL